MKNPKRWLFFLHFRTAKNDIFLIFLLNLVTMETNIGSGKQTVFFVVMDQKNTIHKV